MLVDAASDETVQARERCLTLAVTVGALVQSSRRQHG